MISKCDKCLTLLRKQQKEPMLPREIPLLPWQHLGADIAEYEGKAYLVVVDYYSKYIEALRMNGKKAGHVIKALREIFSRYGYPETFTAVNNPFNSKEMDEYATKCSFRIVHTSLLYSQSNGLAEKAVGIVKGILGKGCDLNEALLVYHNTPISNFPYSPNQMILSRQVRTKLPVHPSALAPVVHSDIRSQLQRRQTKTREYYDKGSKTLPPLKEGDTVRFQKPGKKLYTSAMVSKTHGTPRSYVITDQNGSQYRRNRRALRLTKEPVYVTQDDLFDSIVDLQNEKAVTFHM